jgi:hypothetical protein
MSPSPSRQVRRALQRRARRVLDRLRGFPLGAPGARPTTHIILATERTQPVLVTRANITPVLHAVGLDMVGLDEALAEIAEADDGIRYPVLIAMEGWLQCAWVALQALTPGGDA